MSFLGLFKGTLNNRETLHQTYNIGLQTGYKNMVKMTIQNLDLVSKRVVSPTLLVHLCLVGEVVIFPLLCDSYC